MKTFSAAVLFLSLTGAATASVPVNCFDDAAQTRNYSSGLPVNATPTPDGKTILFLRSGARDTLQRLYTFDIASGAVREVVTPEALGSKNETLSAEEKARRERARISARGFTSFELSKDGARVLLSQGGKLFTVEMKDGRITALPGTGWTAPALSPDGTKAAAIKDHELYVLDIASASETRLTAGASATLWHGEAEFAAQEEMKRREGFWWSPDSKFLAYEEADLSAVEPHYIINPLNPAEKPVEFRYPRAGTANAVVRLGVIAASGGPTVWVPWDNAAYPYLSRVTWEKGAPLSLLVLNRDQTDIRLMTADAKTGAAKLIMQEHDAAWIDPETPQWLEDGSYLWMTERNGQRQLEHHAGNGKRLSVLTPASFRFDEVLDADLKSGTVIVSGGPSSRSTGIYRLTLKGGAPVPLATEPGSNSGNFAGQHALFAHGYGLSNGRRGVDILSRDGRKIAELPAVAEKAPALPKPDYFAIGSKKIDAMVLRPRDFDPARKYPVILSVYGGPASKLVWDNPHRYYTDQCMADRGYIVAIADNRGTPGRDSAWIRAVKGNAIDIALADQIEALQGLGAKVPQMDLTRTGVMGWSFGGYFSAMATIRRPDIFAAGIAGAPVIDWEDYDTVYTERYMGQPKDNPAGYKASNVLTYAGELARPLMIIHGVMDDNVYFQNTMQLTLALLKAGKPYDLVLLPGTHMVSDNMLRAREVEKQVNFFAEHLGGPR